ncbi:MAG TPA: transcriptional regulator GutM [Candidatus Luteococcus avicola]|uniref:Transcriptional regulator GutM n=1 Tax=Luteococcus sanguinis TaxID=174038 RepID=A0ABW1WWZ3_9ACTN|nr:transcriptional regulator GutM [Candidatus Luteococcus avicola]
MFWTLMIAFAIFYILQMVLSIRQATHYTKQYGAMRRRGRVAIGKQKNLLFSGAIVMFLIDDDDVVVEGSRLNGVTVFSRFRPLEGCAGVSIRDVDALADRRHPKSVRQAIANARHNFMVVSEGLVPEEPPGPITRLLNRSPRTGPVTA